VNDLFLTLHAFLPETLLGLGVVLMVLTDLLVPAQRKNDVTWLGVVAAGAALAVSLRHLGAADTNAALFTLDTAAHWARIGVLAVTMLALLASTTSQAVAGTRQRGEYAICLLGLGLGGLVLASASNLLSFYLGLEIVSLMGYILAGFRHRDRAASEAGMKYVLFGALSSGLTLFGISLLYGLAGTLDLAALGPALAKAPIAAIAAPLVLTAAGIAYKLALVPFHLYAPDVYEGAPAVSLTAVSVIPKIATFAVLTRLLAAWTPETAVTAVSTVIIAVGIATVAIGSFTALASRDAKRILAFSAVAHAGTMLLALAAWPDAAAPRAIAWYLGAYALGNVGAFTALMLCEERGGTSLLALHGTGRRLPITAAAFTALIASLAGVPPFAGFVAKFLVLKVLVSDSATHPGLWLPTAAILLGTVAAAVAYLRIIRALYADSAESSTDAKPAPRIAVALVVLTALASVAMTAFAGLG
jgi:NADH-quinone oxidoreductase subunit N